MATAGFAATITPGDPFRHVVLAKPGRSTGVLHVYLDGDGTPWAGATPAADPTPRHPMVLELMRLDEDASLYLGRPCYHGLADDPGCTAALWTSDRYSDAVVSSMASALRTHLAEGKADRLAFIGYSGGGALARLLAPRFAETAAVVTVAANLDTEAWTAHHRYVRLTGSLNPAAEPPLLPHVYQRHYVGAGDRVVPPATSWGSVDRTTVVVVSGFDHVCCWPRLWPSVLADLARALERR